MIATHGQRITPNEAAKIVLLEVLPGLTPDQAVQIAGLCLERAEFTPRELTEFVNQLTRRQSALVKRLNVKKYGIIQ